MENTLSRDAQTVETAFRFSEEVLTAWDDEVSKAYDLLSSLSVAVAEKACWWDERLPYHINLLDILRSGETDHSRILFQILKYKTPTGRFEWLESLIAFIQERYGKFQNIKVYKPLITAENMRIDLCVRESHAYAVIVENKSHGHKDEDLQLFRYIGKLIAKGYREKQIHVLYLPPESSREPQPQSWGEYGERFKDRYVNFSFRDGVLPWLKERVLPSVKDKDTYLFSALSQYIDHWEGRLGLRAIEKDKNMSIEKIILERLEISPATVQENFAEALVKIREKRKELQPILQHLDNLEQRLLRDTGVKVQERFWEDLRRQLLLKGYEVGALSDKAVDIYNGTCKLIYIDIPFYQSKDEQRLGKKYYVRIGISEYGNFVYGFRKAPYPTDSVIEDCICERFGKAEDEQYWFTKRTPSDSYALNFLTFESPGFNALKEASKREAFMGVLADEIHAYIQDFLHFAKERGL